MLALGWVMWPLYAAAAPVLTAPFRHEYCGPGAYGYSEKKNTAEMIRLVEVLLRQYRDCPRIYLSWDAASWHASKRFHKRVEEVNATEYSDLETVVRRTILAAARA